MLLVLPAIAAVLLDIQSVRVILLVFHGCVIASLATTACQRDNDSVVLLGQGSNSYAYNLSLQRFRLSLLSLSGVSAIVAKSAQNKKTSSEASSKKYI